MMLCAKPRWCTGISYESMLEKIHQPGLQPHNPQTPKTKGLEKNQKVTTCLNKEIKREPNYDEVLAKEKA